MSQDGSKRCKLGFNLEACLLLASLVRKGRTGAQGLALHGLWLHSWARAGGLEELGQELEPGGMRPCIGAECVLG